MDAFLTVPSFVAHDLEAGVAVGDARLLAAVRLAVLLEERLALLLRERLAAGVVAGVAVADALVDLERLMVVARSSGMAVLGSGERAVRERRTISESDESSNDDRAAVEDDNGCEQEQCEYRQSSLKQ